MPSIRLLLDECVPKALRRELTGHEVSTVQSKGWAGQRNGALRRLAVVILVAASNDVDDLRPLVPELADVFRAIQPGQIVRIGG